MDSKTFLVCAVFADEEDNASLFSIPLSKSVQESIEEKLTRQKSLFDKLERVEYDGRYKVDSDECLVISNYKDPDGVIKTFLDFCIEKK